MLRRSEIMSESHRSPSYRPPPHSLGFNHSRHMCIISPRRHHLMTSSFPLDISVRRHEYTYVPEKPRLATPSPSISGKRTKEDKTTGITMKNESIEPEKAQATIAHKIRKTINEYGSLPLAGIPVREPLEPKPETLLAIVIHSMLRSTRISHDLAQRASVRVMAANYHDIKTLTNASWDEKVRVLSEGGYNRYRESTATKLGDLADLVNRQYDGDLNNLLRKAENKLERVRQLIREIKGFGDVATDLFCDDAQAIWSVLAPTIDHRSLDTAEEVGIGKNIDAIYSILGRDPVEMSKLARGLSSVRLSKRKDDIEQEE